eukprot:1157346-Pelagomonas_calceolata.AAC.13
MQVLGGVMELGIRDDRLGMREVWRHSGQDAAHETMKQQKSKGKVSQPADPDLVTQTQQAHGGPSSRKVCIDSQLNTKHHAHMALEHAKVLITCNVATLDFNDNALEAKLQQFEDGDTLC